MFIYRDISRSRFAGSNDMHFFQLTKIMPKLFFQSCVPVYIPTSSMWEFFVFYNHVFSLYFLKHCGMGNTISILQIWKLRARTLTCQSFTQLVSSRVRFWNWIWFRGRNIKFYLLLFQDIIWKTRIVHKGP